MQVIRFAAKDIQNRIPDGGPTLQYLPFLNQPTSPFVQGQNHILAAAPKVGKTELLFQLVREWGEAGLKVLYFTEEDQSNWDYRLGNVPLVENVDFVFAVGLNSAAIAKAITVGEDDVVIIDTLRLLPWQDEKDNSEIFRMMTPITSACKGKTGLFAYHNRKGGGDKGENISGGHAFSASVDRTVTILPGSNLNRRFIKGSGRLVTIPPILYEMQDGAMVYMGDPKEATLDSVRARVVAVLTPEWQSTKEVHQTLALPKPSARHVTTALNTLAEAGTISRLPEFSEGELPGRTYKWKLT